MIKTFYTFWRSNHNHQKYYVVAPTIWLPAYKGQLYGSGNHIGTVVHSILLTVTVCSAINKRPSIVSCSEIYVLNYLYNT